MAIAPHQSTSRHVRFPGASIAAQELGVHRGHLHRVLTGERQSKQLLARWKSWLKAHPEFAQLNPQPLPGNHPQTASPTPAAHCSSTRQSAPSSRRQTTGRLAGTPAANRPTSGADPGQKASGASPAVPFVTATRHLRDLLPGMPREDRQGIAVAMEALSIAIGTSHHPTTSPPTFASGSTPQDLRDRKRAKALLRAALALVAQGHA